MISTNDNVLLDTATAAEQLTVKPITLEKWRLKGRGPAFIKIGRLVRYRKSDLDRWLAKNTVRGDAA